jgi:hypothetical protein
MMATEMNGVVPSVTPLPATLADSARIFDRHGLETGSEVIAAGVDVDVFGLAQPDLVNAAAVLAAFVIYDNSATNTVINGEVIDVVNNVITVNAGDKLTTITECADASAAEIIYLSIIDGKLEHNEINAGELATGVAVTVYGTNDGTGCLAANAVVAVDATVMTQ